MDTQWAKPSGHATEDKLKGLISFRISYFQPSLSVNFFAPDGTSTPVLLFQTLATFGLHGGLTAEWNWFDSISYHYWSSNPASYSSVTGTNRLLNMTRQPKDANTVGCTVSIPLTQMSSSDVLAKQIKLKDNIALSSTLCKEYPINFLIPERNEPHQKNRKG